jgi:hypothetical protein
VLSAVDLAWSSQLSPDNLRQQEFANRPEAEVVAVFRIVVELFDER